QALCEFDRLVDVEPVVRPSSEREHIRDVVIRLGSFDPLLGQRWCGRRRWNKIAVLISHLGSSGHHRTTYADLRGALDKDVEIPASIVSYADNRVKAHGLGNCRDS